MKITIVSPLFPPDAAFPAPYVKALSTKLALTHTVTVLAYTYLPETVQSVQILVIDKRQPLFRRLFAFTCALKHELKEADVVIVQNGISTELPALLLSYVSRTPMLLEQSDTKATTQTSTSWFKGAVSTLLAKRVSAIVDITTGADTYAALLPPEHYLFQSPSATALAAHKDAWERHLGRLQALFVPYEK